MIELDENNLCVFGFCLFCAIRFQLGMHRARAQTGILGLGCSRARLFSGSVIPGLGYSRARPFSGSAILGLGHSRARSFSGSIILGLGHSRARSFSGSVIPGVENLCQ